MRRILRVKTKDGHYDLEISKAIAVDVPNNFIEFRQRKDLTWQLSYSKQFIPDFTTIKAFEIIRED